VSWPGARPLVGSNGRRRSSSESKQATEEGRSPTPPPRRITRCAVPSCLPAAADHRVPAPAAGSAKDAPRMVRSNQAFAFKHPLRMGRREAHLLHQGGDHRGPGAQHDRAEHRRQRPVSPRQPVGPPARPQGRASSKAHAARSAAPPAVHLPGAVGFEAPSKSTRLTQQASYHGFEAACPAERGLNQGKAGAGDHQPRKSSSTTAGRPP